MVNRVMNQNVGRLAGILILIFLLSGCGVNSQPGADDDFSSDIKKSNYTCREIDLPDPDICIEDEFGELKTRAPEPMLCGNMVFRQVTAIDSNGNYKDDYFQSIDVFSDNPEWNCLQASRPFELDGKSYSGFGSPYIIDENDQIYASVYISGDEQCFIGRLDSRGVTEIICEFPKEPDIKECPEWLYCDKGFNDFCDYNSIKQEKIFLKDLRYICRKDPNGDEPIFSLYPDYIIDECYSINMAEDGEIQLLTRLDGNLSWLGFREKTSETTIEKEEIVITFAMEQRALERTISRFNRQSDRYHVTMVTAGENENADEYRDGVKLAISTGGGPDLLGHDIITDIEPYVSNGYLECLDDVIVDDSDYLKAAIDNCRIGGSMYGIPYDCSFEFVAYLQENVNDSNTLNINELMERVENSDAKILQKGIGGSDIVIEYGLKDDENNTYIDWENGESHLTEPPFIKLLQFAKKYADNGKLQEEEKELLASGESFSMRICMDDFEDWDNMYDCLNGTPAILGYPSCSGNGFYVISRELYLNANSQHKEGAKEFLRFLISETEQKQYVQYDAMKELDSLGTGMVIGHKSQFPICKSAYKTMLDAKIRADKKNLFVTDSGSVYGKQPYNDGQIASFYYMLDNSITSKSNIDNISDIVSEELEPYFRGDITENQAAEKLDNRVKLYMAENR